MRQRHQHIHNNGRYWWISGRNHMLFILFTLRCASEFSRADSGSMMRSTLQPAREPDEILENTTPRRLAVGDSCSSSVSCTGSSFCSDVNEIGKICEAGDTCICVQTASPTSNPTYMNTVDIHLLQPADNVIGTKLQRIDSYFINSMAKIVAAPNVTTSDALATSFSWSVYDTASLGTALSLDSSIDTSREFLVLPARTLDYTKSYIFSLTETRDGTSSTVTLLVLPSSPPNGSLSVNNVVANTTVADTFLLRAENWTQWYWNFTNYTSDVFPLKYRFVCDVGNDGNVTTLRSPSYDNSTVTALPLGHGADYDLVVRVVVTSVFGGVGQASRKVTVGPPRLQNAVAVVNAKNPTLDSLISKDWILRAGVLLYAQSQLLNHVLNSASSGANQINAALTSRSTLIDYANMVASRAQDVDTIEVSMLTLASLTASARSNIGSSEQSKLLGAISTLTNHSSTDNLGSISTTAAWACFSAVSGLLQTPNVLRLSDGTGNALDDALIFLGDAMSRGMVPGESAHCLSSKYVAMSTRSVNRQFLSLNSPYFVFPPMSSEFSDQSRYPPSFEFPATLLNGVSPPPGIQKRISITTTDWAVNPYLKQATTSDSGDAGWNGRDGRRLQKNSSISRLTIDMGRYDANIPSPVTVKVALPLHAAQYRSTKQQHNLTCKDEREYDDDKRRSSQMDRARYNHCMQNRFGKYYSRKGSYVYQNRSIFCDEIASEYFMKCTNLTGNITFTCPAKYYIARASTWNDVANAWKPNDNCTSVAVDFTQMYASFACTQLGSITAQLHDQYTEPQYTIFQEPRPTKEISISHRKSSKNLLIISILITWAFMCIWTVRDWFLRKGGSLTALSAVFKNENIQRMLEKFHDDVRSRRYENEHVELMTKRDVIALDLERNEIRSAQDVGDYDSDEEYETGIWDRLCPYFTWCVFRGRCSIARIFFWILIFMSRAFSIIWRRCRMLPPESKLREYANLTEKEALLAPHPDPVDSASFEEVYKTLVDDMNTRTRILYNFVLHLKNGNEIASFFFPFSSAWNPRNTALRAVTFHAKFLTVLTIACLCSQKFYRCEEDGIDDELFALNDHQDRWWLNGYLDFPDFWKTLQKRGFWAAYHETRKVTRQNIWSVVLNTLWTIPVTVYIAKFYELGDVLQESDRLNQERLMEHATTSTIVANEDLGTMRDAYVIRHTLYTLERLLSEQRVFVEDVKLAYLAKFKFSSDENSWFLTDDAMREIRVKTARYHSCIRPARRALSKRMKEITHDDIMMRYQNSIELWGRGFRAPCSFLHFQRKHFWDTVKLEREVRIGTVPSRLQMRLRAHTKILIHLAGSFIDNITFDVVWRFLKVQAYKNYVVNGVGCMGDASVVEFRRSVKFLLKVLGILYLLTCTTYVFYFCHNVRDNVLINNIFLTAVVNMVVCIFFTGPAYDLAFNSLLPAIAMWLVMPPVLQFLHHENIRHIRSTPKKKRKKKSNRDEEFKADDQSDDDIEKFSQISPIADNRSMSIASPISFLRRFSKNIPGMSPEGESMPKTSKKRKKRGKKSKKGSTELVVRDTSNSVLDEDSVENTLTFEKEGNVSSDEESEAKGSRESKDLTPTESSISPTRPERRRKGGKSTGKKFSRNRHDDNEEEEEAEDRPTRPDRRVKKSTKQSRKPTEDNLPYESESEDELAGLQPLRPKRRGGNADVANPLLEGKGDDGKYAPGTRAGSKNFAEDSVDTHDLGNADPETREGGSQDLKNGTEMGTPTSSADALQNDEWIGDAETESIDNKGAVILGVYDHVAGDVGELNFSEGDSIEVVQKHDDAWWEGKNLRTGEVGIFPVNYTDAA